MLDDLRHGQVQVAGKDGQHVLDEGHDHLFVIFPWLGSIGHHDRVEGELEPVLKRRVQGHAHHRDVVGSHLDGGNVVAQEGRVVAFG